MSRYIASRILVVAITLATSAYKILLQKCVEYFGEQ
ncbi:MAG: hypothetical protein QOF19_2715 [Alphaproteobacteria bacterium]|jgi:hypothetical protein|nr:hypothetical protein [Alphaproteobacteria bacterium]